jgi:uncharacterized protein YprB with RNaseH-like and TPR domain
MSSGRKTEGLCILAKKQPKEETYSGPKILTFDLESCGVNALKSDLGFITLLGYKWLHEKEAHVLQIDEKALKQFDDRELLEKASKLFEEADLLVGHFASVFDKRFIQGRLLINGLPPIPATKLRDTCMIARSAANFSSNRLKHLAKILNLKNQKLESNWPMAWFKIMQGDTEELSKLAEYCRGDVEATEELYLRLRPFDTAHPRIIMNRSLCPVCSAAIQYRGTAFVNNKQYRRYQCTSCHKWGRETKAIQETN